MSDHKKTTLEFDCDLFYEQFFDYYSGLRLLEYGENPRQTELVDKLGNDAAKKINRIDRGYAPDMETFIIICDHYEFNPAQFFHYIVRNSDKKDSTDGIS